MKNYFRFYDCDNCNRVAIDLYAKVVEISPQLFEYTYTVVNRSTEDVHGDILIYSDVFSELRFKDQLLSNTLEFKAVTKRKIAEKARAYLKFKCDTWVYSNQWKTGMGYKGLQSQTQTVPPVKVMSSGVFSITPHILATPDYGVYSYSVIVSNNTTETHRLGTVVLSRPSSDTNYLSPTTFSIDGIPSGSAVPAGKTLVLVINKDIPGNNKCDITILSDPNSSIEGWPLGMEACILEETSYRVPSTTIIAYRT